MCLSGRKLPLHPSSWSQTTSYSSHVPGAFQTSIPFLVFRLSVCEQVSLHRLFKRTPRSTEALHFTWMESLLIFIVRWCGDSSSRHWYSELGHPCSSEDTSKPRYPSQFFNFHTLVWDQTISCLHPSSHSWHVFFLYILSCRTSVQLVFRWFSKVIVL